jgi:hypothetical protein
MLPLVKTVRSSSRPLFYTEFFLNVAEKRVVSVSLCINQRSVREGKAKLVVSHGRCTVFAAKPIKTCSEKLIRKMSEWEQ